MYFHFRFSRRLLSTPIPPEHNSSQSFAKVTADTMSSKEMIAAQESDAILRTREALLTSINSLIGM